MANRVDNLRSYLQALAPETRALLADRILSQSQSGAAIPGADIIMRELHPGLPASMLPADAGPDRLFFLPAEPFFSDRDGAPALPGQIARPSLEPIWRWICRDLVPGRAKTYAERVAAEQSAARGTVLASVVRLFQDEVGRALAACLSRVVTDERARSRLAAQVGTARAVQELRILLQTLQHQDPLAQLAAGLPPRIENLAGARLESILNVIKASNRTQPEMLPFVLLLIGARLAVPWQMIRLAVRAAESDQAAQVAAGPLAAAVNLIFARIHADLARIRTLLKAGRAAEAVPPLRAAHDAIRALRTEMELSKESSWSRELTNLRKEISDLLQSELETVPGRVRRLLRVRGPRDAEQRPAFDPQDVAEVAGSLDLVCACRYFAGELALNQLAPRLHGDLQHYVEGAASQLIDGLRAVTPQERKLRQPQIDALVVIAGRLFGADYGALLAKAANLAASDPRILARA